MLQRKEMLEFSWIVSCKDETVWVHWNITSGWDWKIKIFLMFVFSFNKSNGAEFVDQCKTAFDIVLNPVSSKAFCWLANDELP